MLCWLKEFGKDCPWYFCVLLALWGWLTTVGWMRTSSPWVAVPAMAAGLYLIKRWKLLPNPFFHLSLFLSGLLAVVICDSLMPVFLTWNHGYAYTWPEYPALLVVSMALATAVALVVPRLPFLRLRLPASAILSPAYRVAICLFLLIVACYEVSECVDFYILSVIYCF